jgi:hypothetical protein
VNTSKILAGAPFNIGNAYIPIIIHHRGPGTGPPTGRWQEKCKRIENIDEATKLPLFLAFPSESDKEPIT